MSESQPILTKLMECLGALPSNPIALIIGCMITTLIFWIVWCKRNPIDEEQVKRLDYIWLSAAALGLIAQAGDVRLQQLETVSPHVEQSVQSGVETLEIQFQTGALVNRAELNSYDKAVLEEMAYLSKTTITKSDPPTELNDRAQAFMVDLPSNIKGVQSAELASHLKTIESTHERYLNSNSYLTKLKQDREPTVIEKVLTTLSPLLLMFALAVRFLKVFREVEIVREKKRLALKNSELEPSSNVSVTNEDGKVSTYQVTIRNS